MSGDNLVIVPIPALVAILLKCEEQKGLPLTEDEVLAIRDRAACVVMTQDAAAEVTARRGYDDIAPENVWEDWNAVRSELG